MRKLLFLISLISCNANAHSQTPREIKAFSADERYIVMLDVSNLNDYAQSYEVLVENRVLGTYTLKPGEDKKIRINVDVPRRGEWNHKIVSTRSVLQNGEMTRTEIETRVSVFGLEVDDQ
ncbi:hypothetical protein VT25_01310 [Photobacterium leiognathi subsp. mandapamensis]|nr:hypothetical protein VT25_01310 [Photobacterium leiognathi subsp. mandapamensis]